MKTRGKLLLQILVLCLLFLCGCAAEESDSSDRSSRSAKKEKQNEKEVVKEDEQESNLFDKLLGGASSPADEVVNADTDADTDEAADTDTDETVGKEISGFSVKFGSVTITELPVSASVLEEDGWVMEEMSDDGLSYFSKDDNYIGVEFADGSKDMISTIFITNGNYYNGYFDISEITLFDRISFASADAAQIRKTIDPDGKREGIAYNCYEYDEYNYFFEFLDLKGFTSCGISRDNEENFNISMSCDTENSGSGSDGQTGGDSENDGNEANEDRPKIVESRFYAYDEEDWQTYAVHIYDNGDWTIYFEGWGAEYIEVPYSYAEEAAGEYVQVISFNLGGDPEADGTYMPDYIGHARFLMTESELKIKYQDQDEWETYQRKYN